MPGAGKSQEGACGAEFQQWMGAWHLESSPGSAI